MDCRLDTVIASLGRGEVVAVPTDTVYGIAVPLADSGAIARLFEVKGRSRSNAVAVLVDGLSGAAELAVIDEAAAAFAGGFWPGALTLVVRRRRHVTADLGGDPTTIGLRHADSELITRLIRSVGPLVTTSANIAGSPALTDAPAILAALGDVIGTVYDDGPRFGEASTVVDTISSPVRVLREGAISERDLRAATPDGI